MGAIYEMGVLAALEERLEGASVNDFDLFVGVSAGSYVGTLLANGISPTVLYRSVTRSAGSRSDLDDMQLFRLNLSEILVRLARAPVTVAESAWDYFKNGRETTLTDLVASLSAVLPSGFFTLEGLEEWLEVWLSQPGRTNDFRQLRNELRCVAVELDTGHVAAFGAPGLDQVPISRAVKASCALPGLYRPVRIGDSDYIDGGVRKTAHISLAIRDRCGLVVCVNPIVPLRVTPSRTLPRFGRIPRGALASRGLLSVLDQVFRLTLHTRLQYGLARYARERPDVDILVFEPKPEDLPFFMRNIMRTSGRVRIAEFAYRSTMQRLDEEHGRISRVLARHGLGLRPAVSFPRVARPAPPRRQPGLKGAHDRLLASLDRLEKSLDGRKASEAGPRARSVTPR